MRRGSVHIAEEDNWDEPGRAADEVFYLGTFYGHHDVGRPAAEFEGLSIDAAIAWGRARADRVYVRLGDDDVIYAAGAEPSQHPRWPPPGLPELVRRRPAAERWKDRTDADGPIAWSVDVMLEPPDLGVTDPGRVEVVAQAAGADGWDDEELQGFERDIEAAVRRAPPGVEEVGWFSTHRRAYRLRFTESAPTRERAAAQALGRCAVPDGWSADASATPVA